MPRHGDNIRQRTKTRADGSAYVYYTTDVDMGADANGKRIRLPYQHPVRAEVERCGRRTKLVERDQGLKPAVRDKSTVGGWCEHWLDVIVTRQYKPPTYKSYRASIHSHVIPFLRNKRLDKLTPTRCRRVGHHAAAGRAQAQATGPVHRTALSGRPAQGAQLRAPPGLPHPQRLRRRLRRAHRRGRPRDQRAQH